MAKRSIVIVNPYKSTGYSYSYIAKSIDINVIALWTSRDLEVQWKNYVDYRYLDKILYAENFLIDDYSKLVKEFNIVAFIPVDDIGFPLCDKLQFQFFPERANLPELQSVRENKFNYLEYLKSHNIVKTSQRIITDEKNIENFNKKMILKPVNGAGNENIFVVNNDAEVRNIVNSKNNIIFTLQDFLEGDEFCVELCSMGEIHICTAVMKYGREYFVDGISPWRYDNELVDSKSENIRILVDYAKSVISSLGIRIGLTWTQIKLTNGVPNLIECNFRSQGHGHLGAVKRSTHTSYAAESLRAYLGKEENFAKRPILYDKYADFRKLSLNNRVERYIENLDFSEIVSLNSVVAIWPNGFVYPGYAKKTTGFKNSLAMIILCNENTEEYFSDLEKITKWQSKIEGTNEILKT